jgi:hypothetical protein
VLHPAPSFSPLILHLFLSTYFFPTYFITVMKFTNAITLALPALAAAYPGMGGGQSRKELEDFLRTEIKREEAEKREAQLLNPLGNLLSALGDSVSGLLNSVGQAIVVKSNLRPEPGYKFEAPGPGDSRGPCPGLNLLANYGYLPRNGYVNMGQVIDATARGFNMGTDLSTVLTVFAILGSGDFDTCRSTLVPARTESVVSTATPLSRLISRPTVRVCFLCRVFNKLL